MVTIDAFGSAITQRLDDYFRDQLSRSEALSPQYAALWQAMHQTALGGGKRVRPYLLVLAYEVFGGTDYRLVLDAALSQELLHQSLLIHDDIIDRDYQRHGRPNVAARMRGTYAPHSSDADHFAAGAALIAGDLLLAGAHEVIAVSSTLSSEQKQVVFQNLSESIFAVAGGELLDMETTFMNKTAIDPLTIADLKTARYSFVGPLSIGAQLASTSAEDIDVLRQFGTAIGIAYQLADDLLGLYGDEAVTGKSTLGDIREGKHTFLVRRALELADAASAKKLKTLLGNPALTKQQLVTAQEIIEASGAKAESEAKITQYANAASAQLAKLNVPADAKRAFEALVTKVTTRAK